MAGAPAVRPSTPRITPSPGASPRDLSARGAKPESSISAGTVDQVLAELGSSKDGLSDAEAAWRLKRDGPNALPKAKGTPLARKLVAQFTHTMALLLWCGGALAMVAGMAELAWAIWMVNVINGFFSFWQEFRAQKATEALNRMLPAQARVRRGGRDLQIPAEELVQGDVLLLGEGEHISADARIIWEAEVRVDLSVLTGESRPSSRTAEPCTRAGLGWIERPNLVFAGSTVTSGAARAAVFATADRSEFGRIAELTQSLEETPSPLQLEMARVTRTVTRIVLGVGCGFFVLAVWLAKMPLAAGFIFALGMLVAFVPEGLLSAVTLSLAMGVQRMARRHALLKRLSAVETLGCTNVICTDKTGTLTQNQMTVREIWLPSGGVKFEGTGYDPAGSLVGVATPLPAELEELIRAASLCSDARLLPPSDDQPQWSILGDPTEGALQTLAAKAGLDPDRLARDNPRSGEIPFDSSRKRMSVVVGEVLYLKGAPREVVERCQLEAADRDKIMAANDRYAREGLRVLAVASRRLNPGTQMTAEAVERDLTFLGLVAMHDPPRPEVTEAVRLCHQAGIRILMITGDYGLTAESVARRIGIITQPNPRILTGADLERLEPAQLVEALRSPGELLFARVAPEHKLRVVEALQSLGHVVAVTGDGVNDAPALRKADIGVAMGRSGVDVARESADMVLADDSFASIVSAVEEGRAVYVNIRRFVSYIFTVNATEAVPFILFAFSQGHIPLALSVLLVLCIDLGTDLVPALALGAEPPEPGIMERPPRDRQQPIISAGLLVRSYLFLGSLQAIATISAFFFAYWSQGWWGHWLDLPGEGPIYRMACSMTMAAVVSTQIGNLLAHRTEVRPFHSVGLSNNRLIWVGIASEVAFLLALLHVPLLQRVFGTSPISLAGWLYVAALMPTLLVADELRKTWVRWRQRERSTV